jgi:type I restriction enzyme S subunit
MESMVLKMRKMKDSGIEWIGEIPEGWEISKVSYFYEVQLGKMLQPQKKSETDTEEKYLCAANVGKNSLSLDTLKTMWFSQTEKHQFDLKEGDLLVVEGGDVASCAIIETPVRNLFFQNALHRVRPLHNESVAFLRYWLMTAKSYGYIDLICNKATIAHFSKEKFIALPIPVIPQDIQSKIVSFLDLECKQIDDLLSKSRSSIEEHKKLKQAVITQAVTKGVRGEREMKDSGVEWIGEIPAEWSVQRIKTIFSIRNERNYLPLEQVNLISLYTDKGVVQHCDIEKTTGNKASNADGYKKVYPNDMIVNIILCWMGAIGRSNYAGVTSPAYDVYVPSSKIECKFYHYYFRTLGFSGDCYKNGRGIMAMRWRTYSDQFRSIKVVVPPLEEQKEIVGYLDAKCAEIDGLIAKKEQLVKELENYKKSLIYEVVTGKREV